MKAYMDEEKGLLVLEGVKFSARNFSGKPSEFNDAGKRNFCIRVEEPDIRDWLIEEGWKLRPTKILDDDGNPKYYNMPVIVRFNYEENLRGLNPVIHTISGGVDNILDEAHIDILDSASFSNVDVTLRQRHWSSRTGSGNTTYLSSMYATLMEDPLAYKYEHLKKASNEESSEEDDDEYLPFN